MCHKRTAILERSQHIGIYSVGMSRRGNDAVLLQGLGKGLSHVVFGGIAPPCNGRGVLLDKRQIILFLRCGDVGRALRARLIFGKIGPLHVRAEQRYCISAPWFKHYDKAWIDLYVQAYRKVTENYAQLLEGDTNKAQGGIWYGAEADRKAPQKS